MKQNDVDNIFQIFGFSPPGREQNFVPETQIETLAAEVWRSPVSNVPRVWETFISFTLSFHFIME